MSDKQHIWLVLGCQLLHDLLWFIGTSIRYSARGVHQPDLQTCYIANSVVITEIYKVISSSADCLDHINTAVGVEAKIMLIVTPS